MTRANRNLILIGTLLLAMLSVALAGEVPASDQQTGETLQKIRGGEAPPASEARTSAPAAARGHYKTLLKTLEVPDDRSAYGDFCDYGYWAGPSYAGHDDLPAGYWVYLSPNWYIFKEASDAPSRSLGPRPWGAEQATGAPNTWPNSGDLNTAWASATPDGQREWLELNYEKPVRPVAVLVYETFNPGAVDRVIGYDTNGKEVALWSGSDPTPAGSEKGVSVIPIHPDFDLTRIRIELDSPKVPGWNEIDAVGLLDDAGTTQWARSANASSTYADVNAAAVPETDLNVSGGVAPYTERERLDASHSTNPR